MVALQRRTQTEDTMSKRKQAPVTQTRTPRLIRAGGAKARTNAVGGSQIEEDFPLEPYDLP